MKRPKVPKDAPQKEPRFSFMDKSKVPKDGPKPIAVMSTSAMMVFIFIIKKFYTFKTFIMVEIFRWWAKRTKFILTDIVGLHKNQIALKF